MKQRASWAEPCLPIMQTPEHREGCARLETSGWDACWSCGARTCSGNMHLHQSGRKHQLRMRVIHSELVQRQVCCRPFGSDVCARCSVQVLFVAALGLFGVSPGL